ncbi:hypothetical protein QFW80_16635 [Luteimonas sp. M1R5S18]|uniref:Uncharacterized protein n=1 Tax=Luteimonas rhizosphaericola TaxID=3042024 RepID=A0ABT6JQA9_9GAMM|nr:hypothetical protein [Luteimonas rhizosphaericola]MDH5832146.1 hypothetical protein [Luteimonas rhizosphaericola]
MSARQTLSVATVAGLTLELSCQARGPDAGHVNATLYVPEGKAEPGATLTDRTAAFLCGGRIGSDVHVDARTHLLSPPVLWLRGAAIDIDDDTAATVEAWLASRPRPQATAPDTAVPA